MSDVQRPGELAPVEVEGEDAVETGRGEVQAALVDRDLVAMPEVRVAPRSDQLEVRRVGEELVARGDVDDLAVEGDAAQAAVPAAALPVDGGRVPVDDLPHVPSLEVDEVHAAVALALVAAADDGRRDELHGALRPAGRAGAERHPVSSAGAHHFLLKDSPIVRGRCSDLT